MFPPTTCGEDAVVGVVVLDFDPMRFCVDLERSLGGDCFFRTLGLHQMHVAEIRVVVNEYTGILVSFLGKETRHLSDESWRR